VSSEQVRIGSTWKERAGSSRVARVIDREPFGRYAVIEVLSTGKRTRVLISTFVEKWEVAVAIDPESRYVCPKCGKQARPFGEDSVTWSPKHGAFFHTTHRKA
jgi:hypothetical protein